MKILYLTHPESDYGDYMLFDGLCRELGDDQIVTFPFKQSYYGQVDNGYILDDGKVGCTAPGSFMEARSAAPHEFADIRRMLMAREFDLIVLAAPRTYALRALADIFERGDAHRTPLVICDGQDDDLIRDDLVRKYDARAYFKREHLTDRTEVHGKPLWPLPFSILSPPGIEMGNETWEAKDRDVFFAYGQTHPDRDRAHEQLGYLSSTQDLLYDGGTHHFVLAEYHERIGKSRIALSVRGYGRDTVRFWEILGHKTALFAWRNEQRHPNMLRNEEHCIWFDGVEDLLAQVRYWLARPEELWAMTLRGHAYAREHHTTQARARWFLERCREVMG